MPVTDLVTSTPATGTVRKKRQMLPMAQPGQPLPLVQPQDQGQGQDLQQSTTNTITQAQRMAAQPQGNTLLQQTNKAATELLNAPALDVNKQKQVQIEQFDRDRAGAIESARQGLAGQSTQDEALLDMAIKGAQDRAVLGNTLDTTLAQQQREQALAKLTAGQSQSTLEQNLRNQQIGNLVSTVGAADSTLNRNLTEKQAELSRAQDLLMQGNDLQGQKDLAEIQAKAAQNQLLTQQDYDRAKSALDRAQQLALQSGDIQAQKEIEVIKQQFQGQLLEKQQTFQAAQAQMDRAQQLLVQSNDIEGQKDLANISNAAQEGRLLTQMDFDKAESALDRAQQTALQNGDTQAQIQIEQIRQTFQAQLQANDQQFQAKIKTMDLDSQKELTTLKAALDKDQLMTQQDFQGAQASLDRELQKAMQSGDINSQVTLLQMKQDFEDKAQSKQNEFSRAERTATQAWESGERISTQDYDKSKQYLDQQFELAKQNNDIDTQKYLQQKQIELDLAMQTAGFDDAQKKMYLQEQFNVASQSAEFKQAKELEAQRQNGQRDAMMLQQQIDDARANGDVARESQLMQFKAGLDKDMAQVQSKLDLAKQAAGYGQAMALQSAQNAYDFKKLQSEQGHDAAMADINAKIQKALQDDDQDSAMELERQRFMYTAIENNKDRALQKLSVDLQAKGLDMQQWEQQYNAIMQQEEAGTAKPGAAREFLNQQLAGTGVKLEETSPTDEYAAIQQQYKTEQFRYLVSHPEDAAISGESRDRILFEHPELQGYTQTENGQQVPDWEKSNKNAIDWAMKNSPESLVLDSNAVSNFNTYMNGLLYSEDGANGAGSVSSTYRTDGAEGVISKLGATVYDGKSVTPKAVFFKDGDNKQVHYEQIARLSSSELNSLINGDYNSGLSTDEVGKVKSTAQEELNARARIVRKINSSDLTPAQKAEIKNSLGLIDTGW